MSRRKRKTPFRRHVRQLIANKWWLIAGGAVAVVFIAFVALFLGKVPLPPAARGTQSSKLLAFDGQLIGTLHGEQNRTIVSLASISNNLQHAVIATEDRSFYSHPGISLKGILRAAFSNVRGTGVEQGGSTITQQYVRNEFVQVGRERTIFRKIKEAALAVKVERKYSKNKILEFYLNTVYFGRGAYGAEAAARTYFKKSANDLTQGEAAYLAGIIKAPEKFQIDRSRQAAIRIRDEVVSDMVKAGYLNPQQAKAAKQEDFVSHFKPGASVELDSPRGAYFVEFVRRYLKEEFKLSDAEIFGGGLEVQTTLDLRLQDAAEAAVSSVLNKPDDPEAAILAMDPLGNVRAMVGGRDVTDLKRARGSNFAANVRKGDSGGRQAGSAFKPFTLATFVEAGDSVRSQFNAPPEIQITSKQCLDDKGNPWKVANFDSESFGTLDVIEATVKSANTVYAQMADLVTPKKLGEMTEKLGIDTPRKERVCALTLGTSPVTPLEMARAYTTFATRGKKPEPLFVTKITAADGKVIEQRKPRLEEVLSPDAADTVNFALRENIKRGTGTGANINRPAGGKTGTTQNHENAWFAGYTPDLTAIVWMGFPPKPDGTIPLMENVRGKRVTGGSFPATIWKKFMDSALKGVKPSAFQDPTFGGRVISPSPSPVPCGAPASQGTALPSCPPSPSPSPTPVPSVVPSTSAVPSPTKKPSPTPSCGPTPTPSPSGSPAASQPPGC